MRMPNCLKKKLKDGMAKGYKSVSLMQVIMYCYTTNVIETVTPEEYIRDTFQNVSDSEKEQVCGTVSKPTPKQF